MLMRYSNNMPKHSRTFGIQADRLKVLKLFFIVLSLFSTVVPSMFLSCRPFFVITTFSTGLVGVEDISVSWLGQLTVGV